MFQFDNAYTIKKMGEGLMDHVVFNEKSPCPGLEIQYGKVQLIEEDDQLRVKFEYEVFSKSTVPQKDILLKLYLGKVLVEILQQEFTYAEAMKERDV